MVKVTYYDIICSLLPEQLYMREVLWYIIFMVWRESVYYFNVECLVSHISKNSSRQVILPRYIQVWTLWSEYLDFGLNISCIEKGHDTKLSYILWTIYLVFSLFPTFKFNAPFIFEYNVYRLVKFIFPVEDIHFHYLGINNSFQFNSQYHF